MVSILVLAPHPDDEVLGMGATIKKLSKKNSINLCVITEGATAQYSDKKMIKVRRESCLKSGKILGISNFEFLDFPDMKLDTIPILNINKSIEKIIKKYKPRIVYTITNTDLNRDHQIVYESTLIATRPHSSGVKEVISYEIPGQKLKKFSPTLYENIDKEIRFKIKAFECYKSEIMKFPHHRSIEAIKNLSIQRGIESSLNNAEAFEVIRSIRD
tara:strand:+ start:363 stop:1007 length:645 start_codon:yes stop_codon:yes gene_type:complete